MSHHSIPSRDRAEHFRELAAWVSDERTHHVLLEMAREIEALDGAGAARPFGPEHRALPRSLS